MPALALQLWGRVQGVGLRALACQRAAVLGINGWVRNNPDGTVSLWAEGPRERLRAFLDWCYTGGGSAEVDRVVEQWHDSPRGYRDFSLGT